MPKRSASSHGSKLQRRLQPVAPGRSAARTLLGGATLLATLMVSSAALAQGMPELTLSLPTDGTPKQVIPALKILGMLTLLTLAPAMLICLTSFTRIIVVLNFARQALGTQGVPPTQVISSLALMLSFVVMAPVATRVNTEALDPYMEEQIDENELYERSRLIISSFLVRQTREADLMLFYDVTKTAPPTKEEDIKPHLLVPAFLISELRTGFEMGFLLFLPFVLVDLVAGAVLTAMGMVMLPPTMLSTPLKVLLFVVVDGWSLLTRSLMASFS